jgi:hypothetical protein
MKMNERIAGHSFQYESSKRFGKSPTHVLVDSKKNEVAREKIREILRSHPGNDFLAKPRLASSASRCYESACRA